MEPLGTGVCEPQAARNAARQSAEAAIKERGRVFRFTGTTPRRLKPQPGLALCYPSIAQVYSIAAGITEPDRNGSRFDDEVASPLILGAGFDARAHRFAELLKVVAVIEIDYGATQE
jgi:hypothetical protein